MTNFGVSYSLVGMPCSLLIFIFPKRATAAELKVAVNTNQSLHLSFLYCVYTVPMSLFDSP